jgi:hypothetical protein
MTLETIVVAVVALLVGAGLTVAGYRYFLILLPIFAFVAGFYAASAAITAIFGTGFLADVTGWIVGFVGGVVFAVLAYFFYVVAVIILAASVGAAIGGGIVEAFLPNAGIVEFLAAAAGAIVVALAAILLSAPKYLVIVGTAIVGAATTIAGVLLLVGQIKLPELGHGPVNAIVHQSPLWSIAFIALTVVGILAQMRMTQMYTLDPDGPRFA